MRKKAYIQGVLASLLLLPASLEGQPAAAPTMASNLRFGRLGVDEGLSHTTVWAVLQDRSGFLWIGTESSLQRYDGYDFVDFRHDPQDPATLSHSGAMVMHEDPGGILYFGTRAAGINRYDPARGNFERFRLEGTLSAAGSDSPSPLVTALGAESGGRVWVGTVDGLRLLDPRTRRLESFRHSDSDPSSLGHDQIGTLFRDGRDRLWVGHGAGLDRYLPERRAFEHLELDGGPALVAAAGEQDGILWAIGMAGGESRLYFLSGGRLVRHASWPLSIDTALRAPDGSFWLGTYGAGLYHYDPRRGSLDEARTKMEDRESISSDHVLGLLLDRAGLLWVASRNGLSIYDPRRAQFEVARLGRGLPANSVGAILVDRRGEAWLGSNEGELIGWRPESGAFRLIAAGLGAVNGLVETRAGKLWVGAGTGLYELDRDSGRLEKAADPATAIQIASLLEDAEGYLWVGHGAGLLRLDAGGKPAPVPGANLGSNPAEGWPRAPTYALMSDSRGLVWAGGADGLFRLDPRSFEHKSWHQRAGDPVSLPYEQVTDILEDPEGRLWVGTYGGGLALFDRAGEKFSRFGSRQGLADDQVCGLVDDRLGGLWVATNRGLSHFDKETFKSRNYDSADGLVSDVFLIQARDRFPDGRVVFGGHQGLTAFYPARLRGDPVAPPVLLTELRVGGEPMRPGLPGSPLDRSISSSERFELDFRQSSFALQFAAPHFANPKKNSYAYRLVGYEEGWTESSAGDRRARYTNLDPGTYTFEVKAGNQDGVWNDSGARLEIAVLPAPWRTPWAYALYAALAAGAFLGYGRWQNRRLERERKVADELARLNAELERLVEARTSEVNQLTGLLPICSGCKKIRDQEGKWQTLETYLNSVGDVKLSHGICRDCAKRFYPELDVDQLAG
jgi:ligand-binding sensor domain-containing protein